MTSSAIHPALPASGLWSRMQRRMLIGLVDMASFSVIAHADVLEALTLTRRELAGTTSEVRS